MRGTLQASMLLIWPGLLYGLVLASTSREESTYNDLYTSGFTKVQKVHIHRNHTDESGIFKSPNYPRKYITNMDNTQFFIAKEGEVIELTMEDFELEFENNCSFDYVTIYDGKSKDAPKIGTFCGTQKPKQVRSSGQFLLMTFHSDGIVTKRGFKGNYKSVKKGCQPNITPAPSEDPLTSTPLTTSVETPEGCHVDHIDGNGTFKSPNYPHNYDNNMDCFLTFTAKDGEVIELTFEDFDLEFDKDCSFDYVEIWGVSKEEGKVDKFCGTKPPMPVRSWGQYISIFFRSDGGFTKRGFKGKYKSVKKENPKCGQTVMDKIKRVVGGNDTTIKEHPWQVALTYNDGYHLCGGAIIAKNWVLTAAHCTKGRKSSDFKVTAGITNNIYGFFKGKTFSIKKKVEHDHYEAILNRTVFLNDIALIEIDGEFDLTQDTTRAVCLADESDTTSFDGESCVVTGWGAISHNGPSAEILQDAYVTVANKTECTWVGTILNDYPGIHRVVDSHMCAGHLSGGIDSCQGDSGGPLVCSRPDGTKVVAGIVSFGYACAWKNWYGYYTRVSYYAKWISDKMK